MELAHSDLKKVLHDFKSGNQKQNIKKKKKKHRKISKLILLILKKKPMDILESSDNSRCALFCAEYSSSPEKLCEILKHT